MSNAARNNTKQKLPVKEETQGRVGLIENKALI